MAKTILKGLKYWWRDRRIISANHKLIAQGYKYAICPNPNGAICYRLHKVGCYQLLPKRASSRPLFFRTIEEIEIARGKQLADKDWLECQHCFN